MWYVVARYCCDVIDRSQLCCILCSALDLARFWRDSYILHTYTYSWTTRKLYSMMCRSNITSHDLLYVFIVWISEAQPLTKTGRVRHDNLKYHRVVLSMWTRSQWWWKLRVRRRGELCVYYGLSILVLLYRKLFGCSSCSYRTAPRQ